MPPAALLSFSSTLTRAGVWAEDEAIYQRGAENAAGSKASARLAMTGDPEPTPAPRGLWEMALSLCHSSVLGVTPSDGDVICYVLNLQPVGGGLGG